METWPGGIIRRNSKGSTVYIIRRMIHGKRFQVSTRRTTLRAAMDELEKFERDPDGYGPREMDRIVLDPGLTLQYLNFCEAERQNSPEWLRDKKRLVLWWSDALKGRDLRRVTMDEIERALTGANDRPHRIVALKHLYAWLVEKGRIKQSDDPTFRRLKVPSARPEQWVREKAISKATHAKWLGILTGPWRDAIVVLGGTGWHVKELERFASHGSVESRGKDLVLLCPRRKSGEPQLTRVPVEVAEAGMRLRARGALAGASLRNEIKYQVDRAKRREEELAPLAVGSYRHSVATWAIEAGADAKAVSDFLGHKSPRTMKKFYATHAAAARPKGIG